MHKIRNVLSGVVIAMVISLTMFGSASYIPPSDYSMGLRDKSGVPIPVTQDGWAYSIINNGKEIKVLGYYGAEGDYSPRENLIVPTKINGLPVTEIGRVSAGTHSVIIPEGVTRIESNAFRGCSSLETVRIPDSVTFIGDGAFYGCKSLKSVILPSKITSIEHRTFAHSGLETITIPSSVKTIGQDAFENCRLVINFKSKTPPSVDKDTFNSEYFRINVPKGSYETYDKALPSGVELSEYRILLDDNRKDLSDKAAKSAIEEAIKKAGFTLDAKNGSKQKEVTVTLSNNNVIPKSAIDVIKEVALTANIKVNLRINTKDDKGMVIVRLTINPFKVNDNIITSDPFEVKDIIKLWASSTRYSLNNYISPDGTIMKWFSGYYVDRDDTLAFCLDYESVGKNINGSIKVAIYNYANLDTSELHFYKHDGFELVELKSIKYNVDEKGYIHFETSKGGIIIISESVLV